MFKPKTEKIEKFFSQNKKAIEELKNIFIGKTNIYIDYANMIYWQNKLGWRFDMERLKQFFDSFDNINSVKIYYGTIKEDKNSEFLMKKLRKNQYDVRTKPVKIMRWSIDVSGIDFASPSVLRDFIAKPLLKKFKIETIEYLNQQLKELNSQGIKYVENKKCNFDVEIGRDMFLDFEKNNVDTFILWSGDSDFADPIEQLKNDSKNVCIFATARRISKELAMTGVRIFEIKKIKEFICRNKDIAKP